MTDSLPPGLRRVLRPLLEARAEGPARPWPGERLADPAGTVERALAAAASPAARGAFVRSLADGARALARVQAAGGDPRPLAGVPLAVKDVLAVAGEPLGAGSAVRDGAAPEPHDAAVVATLRGHGAVVVGRTALHEFAFGVTGVNEHTGSPANPADPDRIPGGSSSGSAVAVASGAALLALASDTGGSARIPAALCGVVGFKPARGEYPAAGLYPLAPTLDHVGLMAPDVAWVRRAHAALGLDPGVDAMPRAVGYVEADLDAAEPEVRAAVGTALDRLASAGVRVEPVAWPAADRSLAVSTAVLFAEAAAVHRATLASRPERYSPEVRHRLAAGLRIDAATYATALAEGRRLRAEAAAALASVDAVATPTVPVVAPPLADAAEGRWAATLVRSTCLLNVTGHPAVSLPLPVRGLPAGLQLAGRDSGTLLGVAAAVERCLRG